MSASGQQLSVALLSMGAIALGATQYLGTPWPGVVLCGLSLLPWGWGAWLGRGHAAESKELAAERTRVDALVVFTNETHARVDELHQQINSLRSTVSARIIMGG